MSKLRLASLLFITHLLVASCCRINLEAEDSSTSGKRMYRSNASGDSKSTVLLRKDGDYIRFEFIVVSSACDIAVSRVKYSNDGLTDTVRISLDTNDVLGQFQTIGRTGDGHLWNVIRDSGPVGQGSTVSTGRHILTLEAVSTDDHGVELDALTLTFTCTTGASIKNECPEFELNTIVDGSPDGSPDDGNGGNGGLRLSPGAIVGIVGALIGVPSAIAGCIVIAKCMYEYDD